MRFTLIITILLSLASPYQLGLATSVTNGSTQATFSDVLLAEAEVEEETITVTETVGPAGGVIRVFFRGEDRLVGFPEGALLYEVPVTVTVSNIPDTDYSDNEALRRSYPPELLRYISPNITVEVERDALDWQNDDILKLLLGADPRLNEGETGEGLIMYGEVRIQLISGENARLHDSYGFGLHSEIKAIDLQFSGERLPPILRISFQVVDATALFPPRSSSMQQQDLGMLTTPPFATYAEGVIRLEENDTSQDFSTHCSGSVANTYSPPALLIA